MATLSACVSNNKNIAQKDGPGDIPVADDTPDAVPRQEPKSPYGNPDSYVVNGKRYYVLDSSEGYVETGIASWYGSKFHGRRTSSGEPYDMYAMTAAHKQLPLPTYVEVTNLDNGRSTVLRVNDRGPFHDNRLIDLSYAAAKKLNIVRNGTGLVKVRALAPEQFPQQGGESIPRLPSEPVYIQVGAFASLKNAELLQNQLVRYNLGDIRILPGSKQKRTIFRVRIGPLASMALADSTVERLQSLGIQEYRVVLD